jgi:NTE family protein
MSKRALYLAGGGARGAYQAGVLKAIQHLLNEKTLPFEIVSGVSVGSINAAIVTEHASDFEAGIHQLETVWSQINCDQIFDASNYGLSKSLFSNLGRTVIKQKQGGYLLNTSPLQNFITENVNFEKIQDNIDQGLVQAFEIISHCYETQQTISFYQNHEPIFEDWQYPRHASQRATIEMKHILASGALPLFFPSVKIDGLHFGDGSMGLVSPLRGVIRFQAEKVLIIGTRPFPNFSRSHLAYKEDIGFANILGSMLSGLFLDNLDRDIEMVNRMNDIARLLSLWKKRYSPWRPIQTLCIRPSMDVASLAQAQYESMSTLLRFMLNLLGAKKHSGDLLSFLLFEAPFTRELITLGYQDGINQKESILEFFER